MIYQHTSSAADRAIAEAVERAVHEAQRPDDDDPENGAAGMLARKR